MPVTHEAQVFPRLFVTDDTLGLPYLPWDPQKERVKDSRTFTLEGSLCFISGYSSNYCIGLEPQVSTLITNVWAVNGSYWCANAYSLIAAWPNSTVHSVKQPKLAPFCLAKEETASTLPWSGCQSRRTGTVGKYFTFSPPLANGSFHLAKINSLHNPRATGNPFDLWLLCGLNGSCTDLTPVGFVQGARVRKGTLCSQTLSGGDNPWIFNQTTEFRPTPVCVWPPFLWVVSNLSDLSNINQLNCSENDCYYMLCWNATEYPLALIMRLPRFIPVPVVAPSSLSLFREKRDFGVSAIIVSILAAVGITASVTASALALSGTVQTVDTINQLSATITMAMDKGHLAYSQLQGGLLLVNQRIDLVQEQMDVLWQIAQLGCEQKLPGLCVTSIQFKELTRAANLSKILSLQLKTNWSRKFDQTLQELRTAIVEINSTRLDLSLTEGFSSWVSSTLSYFKEWVGVGMFGVFFCFGLAVLFWLFYKLYKRNKREKVMITQALAALERGKSAEAWLVALKRI